MTECYAKVKTQEEFGHCHEETNVILANRKQYPSVPPCKLISDFIVP